VSFYRSNLARRNWQSYFSLDAFPALHTACRARGRGEILSASGPDGRPLAMVFLVWDESTMYYLLTTHAREAGDNGSVSLLIWEAIKRAHARGLAFDLDGVATSGTARFLSGFGGAPQTRMVVHRSRPLFGLLRYGSDHLRRARGDASSAFT
jgi:hypothetical protein